MSLETRSGLLNHKEDRIMLMRALMSLPILLLPLFPVFPSGALGFGAGLLVWFLLNDMNFLLHQHVHLPWTRSRILNRLIDVELSLVTGMTAYNWRISHLLRHHRGNDSWGHGFDWELKRQSFLGGLSYSARGVPIVVFRPLIEAARRGWKGQQEEGINYRVAFLEQIAVLSVMATLCWMAPTFYLPYYFSVLFFSRMTDYENHVGCAGNGAFELSNNSLSESYNWVRYNFGYHTAHHFYPDAHWTKLPSLHEEFAERVPADRISRKAWTGLWTPPYLAYIISTMFSRREKTVFQLTHRPSVYAGSGLPVSASAD